MLDREKRLELNDIFKKKYTVIDNMEYNIDLVGKLNKAKLTEESERAFTRMKAKINRGKAIISSQKEELLTLTPPKIARVLGVNEDQVRYQEKLFNKARAIL